MSLIALEIDASIATIRLNDPASLNALSATMGDRLGEAIDAAVADGSVRVLVITGAGKGFSAGGDVQSFYDHRDDPAEVMTATIDALHGSIRRLLDAPFPTIAAINGVVAGAGMGLAMATDLAIAVEHAVFTMAYTGIGVSPDGSTTFFLPRIVGSRRAMEMILTNRRLTANEALDLGLVNVVVSVVAFATTVESTARRLAAGPTLAYVRARQLVMSSFGADPVRQMEAEADGILAAGTTSDFYEGISAFIEKRPAVFKGS